MVLGVLTLQSDHKAASVFVLAGKAFLKRRKADLSKIS